MWYNSGWCRGVAQLGRALVSGARGREFKSPRPDHFLFRHGAVTHRISTWPVVSSLAALFLACLTCVPAAASSLTIRVLLARFQGQAAVTISAADLQWRAPAGDWATAGARYPVPPQTRPTPAIAGAPATSQLPRPTETPTVAQNSLRMAYRGILEVTASPQVKLINEVDLEDYLRGVVPSEMPSSFPMEALKAQAVAARSYTLAGLSRHDPDADLCDTEHCQAYRGVERENAATDQALQQTGGEVLWVNGRVLQAVYSAACGGQTELQPILGLASCHPDTAPDGTAYCAACPSAEWTLTIPQADLLRAAGETRPTPIRALRVTGRDVSGRLQTLALDTDYGTLTLTGNQFRQGLGTHRLKGLLCTFSANPTTGDIIINGKGFGHGAGLCQWGARGMAAPPNSMDYRQILAHYYPGALLQKAQAPEETAGAPSETSPSQTAP